MVILNILEKKVEKGLFGGWLDFKKFIPSGLIFN